MSDLTFQMLIQCHYTGDDNTIDQLHVEHLELNKWQELELNIYTPGFDIFLYAILSCQHMYFRNNAAEYGLALDSSEGLLTVITNEHRSIQSLHSDFTGKVKTGTVNDDMVASITARMGLCPASINLKDVPDMKIAINFEHT